MYPDEKKWNLKDDASLPDDNTRTPTLITKPSVNLAGDACLTQTIQNPEKNQKELNFSNNNFSLSYLDNFHYYKILCQCDHGNYQHIHVVGVLKLQSYVFFAIPVHKT